MSIERIGARRPESYEETMQTTQPTGLAAGGKAAGKARAKDEPRPGGSQLLVAGTEKRKQAELATFARSDAKRANVAAATSAIRELALAVGEDAAAFAARFAGDAHVGKSSAQIQREARFAFVQDVLSRRPDQAEALIAVRLRGVDDNTRKLARVAVQESGAGGPARYAAAERALATLAGFDPEQRGDLLGMVEKGERFDRAVALERQELGRIAKEAPQRRTTVSTSDLTRQALVNAQTRADAVRKVTAGVQRTLHAIGKLSRAAELIAGTGAAAGTVGATVVASVEAAAKGSTKPLARAAHDAERAGGFIAGELSSKIRAADRTAVDLLKTAERYETVFARHATAIRSGDHAETAATGKQLDSLASEIARLGASLAAQAKSIGKLNADFDGAAEHAALGVLLAGVTYTVASQAAVKGAMATVEHAAASHVSSALGKTAGAVVGKGVEVGIHAGAEGAAARAYGAVRH